METNERLNYKMGNQKAVIYLMSIAVMLLSAGQCESYKVLIAPYFSGFNSRLLNMQKMADILAQDGHQVAVIMNNKVKDHIITKHAEVISFDVAKDTKDVTDMTIEDLTMDGLSFFKWIDTVINMQAEFCENLFGNNAIMKSIRDTNYDLIIADIFSLCNVPLVSHLNIPTIFYQNYGFFSDSNAFFPQFPSFTCHAVGVFCTGDDMSFTERILNALFLILHNYYIIPSLLPAYHQIADNTGLELKAPIETILQDKLMLVNVDYVLDTPRPTMPHVIPISGLFHKNPYPFDQKFQKIIKLAGTHGVVLMSFGTLMPKFNSKTAEKFAKVLGRLNQQVIWRYVGDAPQGLQNNTHLTKWFPQNDLLANPAVKLFITHCGISSTFEAAYNGVPVVAMPLFADQKYNARKLTDRAKIGISLDFYTVTEDKFEDGINEVLSNPLYKENAKRASQIMSDQPVPPVQRFRHLVNFTIKSGGAKHLFHSYAVRMSLFTFYGLDVISFLIMIAILILAIIFCSFRKLYGCCFGNTNKKLKKQ